MPVVPRVVQDSQSSVSAKLTAAHRLLRKNGYDHVVRAENVADKYFKIFFVRNCKACSRLGIIVSKKKLSGAADRNRIKRIIREVFRQHSIKSRGLDLVVMLRGGYPQESSALAGKLKMLFTLVENRCAEF